MKKMKKSLLVLALAFVMVFAMAGVAMAENTVSVDFREDGYADDGDNNDYDTIYAAAGISFVTESDGTYTIIVDKTIFTTYSNTTNSLEAMKNDEDAEDTNYYVGIQFAGENIESVVIGDETADVTADDYGIVYIGVATTSNACYGSTSFDCTVTYDDATTQEITINTILMSTSETTYTVHEETALAYALANATNGGTVQIANNVTIEGDVTIPTGVTLTVPTEKTLTVNGTLEVEAGATLVDTDGSLTGTGTTTIYGSFEVKSLLYYGTEAENAALQLAEGAYITLTTTNDTAYAVVNGDITVYGIGNDIAYVMDDTYRIEMTQATGTLTIPTGKTLTLVSSNDKGSKLTIAKDATLDIKGTLQINLQGELENYGTVNVYNIGKITGIFTEPSTYAAGTINNYGTLTTADVTGIAYFVAYSGTLETYAGSTLEIMDIDPSERDSLTSAVVESGQIVGTEGLNITKGSVVISLEGTLEDAGYGITLTADSEAEILGDFQDADNDGYRIAGKDVLTVKDGAILTIDYRTEVSGKIAIEAGGEVIVNAELYVFTAGDTSQYVGTVTNEGTLTINGTLTLVNEANTVTGAGDVVNNTITVTTALRGVATDDDHDQIDGVNTDYPAIYKAAGITYNAATNTITVDEETWNDFYADEDNSEELAAMIQTVNGTNYYFVGIQFSATGATIEAGDWTTYQTDYDNYTYDYDPSCIEYFSFAGSDGKYIVDKTVKIKIQFTDYSIQYVDINLKLDEEVVYVPSTSTTTYYTITVSAGDNGSISPTGGTSGTISAAEGTNRVFTIKADEGYEISDVTVNGSSVGAVSSYTMSNISADVKISATFVATTAETVTTPAEEIEMTFTDVSETAWYYDSIAEVYAAGLMNGMSEETFAPQDTTTRAMMMQVLFNMAGNPDVDSDSDVWYADAQTWAVEIGVSDGTSMTDNITREQIAAMLYRYAGILGLDVAVEDADMSAFGDSDTVSSYATTSINWAVSVGILSGDGTNLNPQDDATRAEMAAMLTRFMALVTE